MKKKTKSFWSVIRNIRYVFNYQKVQSFEAELLCIRDEVKKYSKEYLFNCDNKYCHNFLIDYEKAMNRLLDLKSFNEACKDRGLDSKAVASHVVLLGNKTITELANHKITFDSIYSHNCYLTIKENLYETLRKESYHCYQPMPSYK